MSQKHYNIFEHKLHAPGKIMYPLVHFIRQCKQNAFLQGSSWANFQIIFLRLLWTLHKDAKSLSQNVSTAMLYLIKVITIFTLYLLSKERFNHYHERQVCFKLLKLDNCQSLKPFFTQHLTSISSPLEKDNIHWCIWMVNSDFWAKYAH